MALQPVRPVGGVILRRAAVLASLAVLTAPAAACGQAVDSTVLAEGPAAPARATQPCLLERIVDGDTIVCRGVGRVRLIGMDTPELDQAPDGDLATDALRALLSGRSVTLELDVEPRDRYGRLLAYVWADGVMANWAMVRLGWAVVLTYPPNVQYVEWFTAAQDRAREDGVGLWAVGGFDCPPRAHRRRQC